MLESNYSVMLIYEEVDPENTDLDHHLIHVAKNNPAVVLYWVRFQCFLQSGVNHPGMLFHLFSKAMIEDGASDDFSEYFEDFIRAYIDQNGFPHAQDGQLLN